MSDSTSGRVAAGLGQSVPFNITGFHMPRVISAEKKLTIAASEAGKKSTRSLRPAIKSDGM
jgi:hypothetical protein